ncbi:MAG: LPS export ABC transporter periplasmic protein LptC [Chitinophagaceae bacterium]|nr:LPS export ABC transporter periplasmic protein LptC [Chitinophagaceae bacterium]
MINTNFNRNFFYTAALLIGCFFVLSCENDERTIRTWTDKVVLKEEAINIESLLSQDGKLKAKMTAPLMQRYFGDTIYAEFPKSLHCDFFDDSARIETWLDSRKGKYFENLNKVYLWDSVVVINRTGDTLKCKDLWWDQNTKLFYSDNYAEYLTKDKKIYPGKGLEATQDFSRVTFREILPNSTIIYSGNDFPK